MKKQNIIFPLIISIFSSNLLAKDYNLHLINFKEVNRINIVNIKQDLKKDMLSFYIDNEKNINTIHFKNSSSEYEMFFYNFEYKNTKIYTYNQDFNSSNYDFEKDLKRSFFDTAFYYYVQNKYNLNNNNIYKTKKEADNFYNFLTTSNNKLVVEFNKEIEKLYNQFIIYDEDDKKEVDFNSLIKDLAFEYLVNLEDNFYIKSFHTGFYRLDNFSNMKSISPYNTSEIEIKLIDEYNNINLATNNLLPFVNKEKGGIENYNYLYKLIYESMNNYNIFDANKEVYNNQILAFLNKIIDKDLDKLKEKLELTNLIYDNSRNKWDLLNLITIIEYTNLVETQLKQMDNIPELKDSFLFKSIPISKFLNEKEYMKIFYTKYKEGYIFIFNINDDSFNISYMKGELFDDQKEYWINYNLNKIIINGKKYKNIL